MKTAMQELIDYMKTYFHLTDDSLEMFDKALEKEKEQIIDAFDYGYHCASNNTSAEITLDGKMHYNQTYNQNKLTIKTYGKVGLSNPVETTNNKLNLTNNL